VAPKPRPVSPLEPSPDAGIAGRSAGIAANRKANASETSGTEPGGCPPGFGLHACQTATGRSPSATQIFDVSVRA